MGDHDNERAPSSQVVIPYWNGDDGNTRPLPGNIVSYACPSIVVTSGPFTPGQPLTLKVTAANYGMGTFTSLVEIRVFWASASAGLATLHPFGTVQTVPVPTHGGSGTTPPITDTIPVSAGPHCCLIASAKFMNDAPGAVPDAYHDRHWAQLNLFAPVVASDGSFNLQFWAGNPLQQRARFDVIARPASEAALAMLGRQVGLRGMTTRRMELALNTLDARSIGRTNGDARTRIELDLRPGEQRAVSIEGLLREELPDEQFAAIEIEQSLLEGGREQPRVIGALGLVLARPGTCSPGNRRL
jgi:hypothetical protein